jgi:hypothetical protein
LHVLSTPPAFVLSQDQTLHRDSGRRRIRKSGSQPAKIEESPCSDSNYGNRRLEHPDRASEPACTALLTFNSSDPDIRSAELPALAFGSHYSVFKERPGTHRSCRWWCRVPEGLFRTDCSAGESPSAVRRPREAVPTGCIPYQTDHRVVNALTADGTKRPLEAAKRAAWQGHRARRTFQRATLELRLRPPGLDTAWTSYRGNAAAPADPSRG